jgi:fructose-1-phosphate kinase PfkB-like protein
MFDIICVSSNNVIDRIVKLDDEGFNLGRICKVSETTDVCGGKAVNVAKILLRFCIKCLVIGNIESRQEELFNNALKLVAKKGLEEQNIPVTDDSLKEVLKIEWNKVEIPVTVNIAIFCPKNNAETQLRTLLRTPGNFDLKCMEKKIKEHAKENQWIVY